MKNTEKDLVYDKYFELRDKIGQHSPKFFIRTGLMNKYLLNRKGKLLDVGCGEGNGF